MRFGLILGLAVPFAAAKVSYDGWKAFSITTGNSNENMTAILRDLNYVTLSCESHRDTLEIAVPPTKVASFEALDIDATVISHDLGAEIAEEGKFEHYYRQRSQSRHSNLRLTFPRYTKRSRLQSHATQQILLQFLSQF
jgi:hypothetical protein